MRDLQGREYLTVEEAEEGIDVEVDGDFTCMTKGEQRTLRLSKGELGFDCHDGFHNLEGQLSDNGEFYLGVYYV
jgi:hypothetical protein